MLERQEEVNALVVDIRIARRSKVDQRATTGSLSPTSARLAAVPIPIGRGSVLAWTPVGSTTIGICGLNAGIHRLRRPSGLARQT
ncbi:MAG: hypothetical protein Ct9H300mP31_05730 [Acidimicrobiaceae bacterium]|nr:MAG: hypothetical protein Ct9H300mP31_05730 [Acidimicrobiaceae bacterium]